MNERIKELAKEAGYTFWEKNHRQGPPCFTDETRVLIDMIVKECIDKIETYCIPVGNSAAGEMACEWTYDALKEIRDEIKEHFGINE